MNFREAHDLRVRNPIVERGGNDYKPVTVVKLSAITFCRFDNCFSGCSACLSSAIESSIENT